MNNRVSIYKALQIEAMFDILNQTDIYFFRKVCRWYSEKFHTPLHEVVSGDKIPWNDVLLHYYECQFEDIGYNNIYELAQQEYIPELAEQFEKDNAAFAKALEEEQARTIEARNRKLGNKPKKEDKEPEMLDEKLPPPVRLNFEDEDL